MPVITPRLKAENFRLPIEKIRAGYKTDTYFNRTKRILELDNHHPMVTMQLFQKVPNAVVCGVDHTLAILAVGTGYYKDTKQAENLFRRYLEIEKELYGMWRRIGEVGLYEFMEKQSALVYVSNNLAH